MKVRSVFAIFLSLIMICVVFDADAQKNKYKRRKQNNKKISKYKGGSFGRGRFQKYWSLGGSISAGNYYGDLAPSQGLFSSDISFTRPGMGFHAAYKIQHSVALRVGFNYMRFRGDDASSDPEGELSVYRYERNLSFRNDVKELQLGLEIYLLPNYGGPNQRLPFNVYGFLGGGVFHHEPQGLVPDFDYQSVGTNSTLEIAQAGEWVNLRPLETEGVTYSNIGFSIIAGTGARMRIPKTPLDLGIEFGWRYLFTDYLDDVSGTYRSLDSFDDPLARILSDKSTVLETSTGDERVITGEGQFVQHTFDNGDTYWINGNLGSGLEGSQRGGSEANDFLFVTQIKLTYVMKGAIRKRAKYR